MESNLFFRPKHSIRISEIITFLNIKTETSQYLDREILSVSSLKQGKKTDISFIQNKNFLNDLKNTKIGAVFCSRDFIKYIPEDVAILVSENAYYDFVKLTSFLYSDALRPKFVSISKQKREFISIHETVYLENNITIEPGVVIGKNVEIGEGSIISANSIIGDNCKIGRNAYIGPNVNIQYSFLGDNVIIHPGCCIGQDGFGFLPLNEENLKIPQLGRVLIQNNVEIGANTTIDRGSLDDTIIGEGTKIDNLVQIAHNVQIGCRCIIAAHCGISGSVLIKDGAILGGRVGLKDHITIGKKAKIAAASGVMDNIPDFEIWGGLPARPIKQWFREVAELKAIGKKKFKKK